MSTQFTNTMPHIMIVDDNQMMRSFLTSFLSKKGYQLSSATNGMEALALLRRGTYPDLIITDIRMPLLDGMGLLDRLKASPMLREIPVIILSGADTSEDRIASFEKGAVDVLTKPFNPIELDLRIRRYLPNSLPAANA